MFCCLFIPDFPAEAVLRFEPELRVRPVVMLAGRPPLERVMGMNANARQFGFEIGALKAQLEAGDDLHPSGPAGGPGTCSPFALGIARKFRSRRSARLRAVVFSRGGGHGSRRSAPGP